MTGLYSIFDNRPKRYGAPFPALNDDTAVRMFMNTMREVPEYAKKDYELRKIGSFDDVNGTVEKLDLIITVPIE